MTLPVILQREGARGTLIDIKNGYGYVQHGHEGQFISPALLKYILAADSKPYSPMVLNFVKKLNRRRAERRAATTQSRIRKNENLLAKQREKEKLKRKEYQKFFDDAEKKLGWDRHRPGVNQFLNDAMLQLARSHPPKLPPGSLPARVRAASFDGRRSGRPLSRPLSRARSR